MPSSTERRKSFGLKSTPSSSTSMSPLIAVAPSDSLLRRSTRVSVPPPALPKGTVHADGACKPGIKKLQASKVAPTSSQTPARQTASVRPPPEPPPDTSSRRPNLSNSIYEFGNPHMSDLARATLKGRMQRDGTYNDPLGRLEPGGSYDKHPPTPPVPPAPPPPNVRRSGRDRATRSHFVAEHARQSGNTDTFVGSRSRETVSLDGGHSPQTHFAVSGIACHGLSVEGEE